MVSKTLPPPLPIAFTIQEIDEVTSVHLPCLCGLNGLVEFRTIIKKDYKQTFAPKGGFGCRVCELKFNKIDCSVSLGLVHKFSYTFYYETTENLVERTKHLNQDGLAGCRANILDFDYVFRDRTLEKSEPVVIEKYGRVYTAGYEKRLALLPRFIFTGVPILPDTP